jgi:hypothetical protein
MRVRIVEGLKLERGRVSTIFETPYVVCYNVRRQDGRLSEADWKSAIRQVGNLRYLR